MPGTQPTDRPRRAAALLEVIFAVVLFAAAGAVVLGSLNASARAVAGMRRQGEAADHAVTILSRMQMGLIPLTRSGPNDFEPPYEQWTWQVEAGRLDEQLGGADTETVHVEIIIRHKEHAAGHRLHALLRPQDEGVAGLPGGPRP